MAEHDVGPERVTALPGQIAGVTGRRADASPLQALQRRVGNRAVCRLLQRSPAGPAEGAASEFSVQRGRRKGKKRPRNADMDDFVVDDDDEVSEDEDFDINLEPPEPHESLEFDNIDPLYRRPGWSATVKAWVRSELQAGAICPCGLKIKPKLVKAPGQRAKKRRKTGGGGMRVNYDIDHHTIKWADRRDAMEQLKRNGTAINPAIVKRVHESKLRLMHASCNVSHYYEPTAPPRFRLVDYDGRPDG